MGGGDDDDGDLVADLARHHRAASARGVRTHTPVRNPSPAHRLHARLHSHDHALHTKFVPEPPATPRPPPLVAQHREFLSRAVLAQSTRDRYQAQVAYGDTAPDDEKVDPDTFICAEAPFPVSMLECKDAIARTRSKSSNVGQLRSVQEPGTGTTGASRVASIAIPRWASCAYGTADSDRLQSVKGWRRCRRSWRTALGTSALWPKTRSTRTVCRVRRESNHTSGTSVDHGFRRDRRV